MKITKTSKIKKIKPIFIYTGYFILLIFFTYIFTLAFLPYGMIKNMAESKISDGTGLKFSIRQAAYSFPFNINFSGIKIYNKTGTASYGSISNANIDLSPLVAGSLLLKKAPLDATISGISVNGFDAGFAKIPPIKLNAVNVNLAASIAGLRDINRPVGVTGGISFGGDLNGGIYSIKAALYRANGTVRFANGLLKIKPSPSIEKSLSFVLNMAFKKGADGYYTYDLKNRSL